MPQFNAVSSTPRLPQHPAAPTPAPVPSFRQAAACQAIDMIVLHHTGDAGTAQEVGQYFQQPSTKVSANYIIGKDGTIVQSVPDELASWHAGPSKYEGRDRVSRYSIGIEICNLGDGKDPYTEAQYTALAHLVLHLQERYDIPVERIVGHKDVAMPRGRKADPSENFSYERLLETLDRLKH